MQHDVFRAGVEPGGLTKDFEIKILVCYMMYEIGIPMNFKTITDVFSEEALGNYFEVASATSQLTRNGHLTFTEDEHGDRVFSLTELGISAASTFEKTLPLTVREKAVYRATKLMTFESRKQKNEVIIEKAADGYILTMTIKDIGSDLLSIKLFVPTQSICEDIKKRFINDPTTVYQGVIALLSGDVDTVSTLTVPASK